MDLPSASCDILLSPTSPSIAFDVEICDYNGSSPSVPKRVQRRLLQTMETRSKFPVSLEDIEAKLKEADTRRQTMETRSKSPLSLQDIEAKLKEADMWHQQFHEWLINKARPKARSPTQSQHPEDLARRLEAKLVAAEQKRMELQAQEHMRLSRLHEIRLAARNEVQLRAEREREELEIKVESRVQQAEMKRLALLEAEKQRRAVVQERMAQSLLQRSTLEDKDRERIEALRALICQRIAAAEEKRVGLLKAEQKRAQAVVLQARKVAKSVSRKREVELRSKKEELEARLQRAKRRRAEYLGQRGGCYGTCHNDRHKMRKHGDRLCRKLTMCWRQFRRSRKTTHGLVQEYGACDIDLRSVTSLPFEQLAARITSPSSLRSVKAVLGRIESRFTVSSGGPSNVAKIDHLLKRLAPPPNKKISSGTRVVKRKPQGQTKAVDAGKDPAKPLNAPLTSRVRNHQEKSEDTKELERYPARVFLCAYMIVGHPEAVFSSRGEREIMLSEAASRMLPEFEALISIISDGPSSSPSCSSSSSSIDRKEPLPLSLKPFSVQLAAFDGAWCAYLYQFVAWKVKDAQSLEEDLIRVACQLEVSMLQKCKGTSIEDGAGLSHDTQAICKQVLEDQQLLRERVFRLTGAAGVTKMKEALLDSRAKFKEAKENGSPLPSPFSSPLASQPETFSLEKDEMGVTPPPKAARSLFTSPTPHTTEREMSMSEPTTTTTTTTTATSLNPQDKELSNERLVNEMLHDDDWLPSNLGSGIGGKIGGQLGDIQDQIKSTMEKAFWDGVIESLLGDHPEYERIIDLFKEIRMELEGLVPQSWKQEIQESIDLELFSQILRSGAQDYDYFHKLLNYTLSIILKLGAPARDEEASAARQKLFEELANISSGMGDQKENAFSYALVKGIRFVLEQLQVLKADISMARIQAMTPLIQGSSGVKYMRSAFAQRYQVALSTEDYLSVSQKLPKTARMMDEVIRNVEQERQEFESSRALLGNTTGASLKPLQNVVPSTVLMRTGGKVTKEGPSKSTNLELPKPSTGNQHKALEWNSIDVVVGLGLLNTICKPEPATEETEAETLLLNIHRIQKIQNSFQQIVVMATGLLLLRQDLVGKGMSGIELEKVLEAAGEQLNSLVNEPTVSMDQIGALLANLSSSNVGSGGGVGCVELFSRVLSRSLSSDDAVFKRVSAGVRASLKALLILGKGSSEGQCLSRLLMQRIGTNHLLHSMLLSMAQGLDKLIRTTCQVHHPWYVCLVGGRTPILNPKP